MNDADAQSAAAASDGSAKGSYGDDGPRPPEMISGTLIVR